MATDSKIILPKETDLLCQGDIFKDVKYSFVDHEDNEHVEIIEFTFPYAVIISQACDVISMSEMLENNRGKPTKFMPSILMCPIYDLTNVKTAEHVKEVFSKLDINIELENIYNKDDLAVLNRDWHYRFHKLKLVHGVNIALDNALIDFKHHFSVPVKYLQNNRKNRICKLDDLFCEQVTLKFSTYISRVAIPL